jgi:hypothetical protein
LPDIEKAPHVLGASFHQGCQAHFADKERGSDAREPMPITWKILHSERLVVATAKDLLTSTDMFHCADEFEKSGIDSYRKIFDLTRISSAPLQADIRLTGARTKARAAGGKFGPIAIVAASAAIAGLARIFEETSAINRPVRVFRDLYSARAWVDTVAPPGDE